MSEYIFLFDLDSTITKVEILPEIAKTIDMEAKMRSITDKTMKGELPFDRSFSNRIEFLKEVPVSTVAEIVANVPLNEKLVEFIKENADRCYVVTGNLDVWIAGLMDKLGMSEHCICSKANVENDRIVGIEKILDKAEAIKVFHKPFVAIGDGNNDAPMIEAAEIGIGFGGVREIAPAVLQSATHATYSEDKLCQFLKQLL